MPTLGHMNNSPASANSTTSSAPLYSPAQAWEGRNDGPGAEHARWHSVVRTDDVFSSAPGTGSTPGAPGVPADKVAVLGFASDEGVRRNHGRTGAVAGPEHLRAALGGLAVHDSFPRYDAGTVTTQGTDLEGAHEELSNRVETLYRQGFLTVVLGGGHETAFGSHRGAFRGNDEQPLGIINLDAHFDLRAADQPTSGTPFLQIARLVGRGFQYSVAGISKPNNTAALFATAQQLGVRVVLDEDLADMPVKEAAALARQMASGNDALHLSIDLDVLAASVAPGVSAPAALGVSLEHIRAMAIAIAKTGKLRLVDVVELNPAFDIDERTAKVAARLIDDIVTAHASASQR